MGSTDQNAETRQDPFLCLQPSVDADVSEKLYRQRNGKPLCGVQQTLDSLAPAAGDGDIATLVLDGSQAAFREGARRFQNRVGNRTEV